jgi:hypothetical protein
MVIINLLFDRQKEILTHSKPPGRLSAGSGGSTMIEAYFQAGRKVKANRLYHLENSSGQKSATETQRGVAATKVNGSPRAVSGQLSAISSWSSALLRLDPEFLSK